ncbi:MFS transporter [Sinorhizobium meliloti]|uniref:MFS transporter n=1 Tax=Rhizobium meliloti TaxID=382 RepID=UPI000FD3DE49|nr:MFS transporter [Sinorhizobium meliloti]RVM11971.1 MFS transporter [Sinorhizobium meliloti]RVM51034.1 MFS transporter [Sinorhizobium meliloti]RVM64128.1 MFS transporter [Sinorhizobium meliloti]RVM69018.1 MFS transporter [Sinorhizobium meliloti]RVM82562.1 MFS transporter [Sinorhizobium meliloti]
MLWLFVMTSIPSSPLPLHRTRIVPAVVAVAFFVQMLDSTIIATSLPAMAHSFDTDVVALNIGFTAYLLAMAVFIAPAGWLADRFGAREVFLTSIVLFTLSSVACGFSGSLLQFTVARLFQGASAALMTPVGRQLVLRGAPKGELVRAIATITWPALIAPVIGPLIGAWITTHSGWQWNFFINLPLGVLGVVLVASFVPRVPGEGARPFDLVGFLLTGGALALTLAGLELSSASVGPGPLTILASGVLTGCFAIRHLQRTPNALLDMAVLKVPTFAFATLSAGTAGRLAVNATPFLLPLLFQLGLGFDAVETGSLVLAYFLGNLLMKSVTTPALRLFGFRSLLVVNGVIAALTIGAFAFVDGETPHMLLFALLVACGLSRSMQFTSLTTIAFADVTPAQRSAATTISAMLQQLAQLLGVAVAASIIRLSSYLRPDGADGGMLTDIRAAFLCIAAIGLASALRFLALPHDAGVDVSGHRRR